MDPDEPYVPLIDEFFEALGAERSQTTRRRLVRTRLALIAHLGPDRSDPTEIARLLPEFVEAPWVPSGHAAAGSHVSVTIRLLTHLAAAGAGPVGEVRGRLLEARERVEEEAAAAAPHPDAARIPARLLAYIPSLE